MNEKVKTFFTPMLVAYVVLAVMIANVSAGDIYYIDNCTILNVPGATYYLTKDIIDSSATICMRITAENVTLDCQGHTIDGKDMASTVGIYSNQSNITVRNCLVTDWGEGIVFEGSNNSIIENITLDSNLDRGIHLISSSGCTIANNTASNSMDGIRLESSNNNRIINNDASSNYKFCIILWDSAYNTITNNNASNSDHGIYLDGASYNTITNNTANSCNNIAIYLYNSNNNILSNNTAKHSNFGIYISSSSNNTVKNSRIENNSQYGIYMYSAGNPANHIYNNLFNNTRNCCIEGNLYANNWNTTKQAGTNIVGKPYIGGNYWGEPDGTGFSEECEDADGDGFCDEPYLLPGENNIDYLPLTLTGPPASITNLHNVTYEQTYINWTWNDPTDADFSHVMVYLNGVFQTNVSKGVQFYNATGLTPDTEYTISTHTVDTSGNINQTWVNHTARTAPAPGICGDVNCDGHVTGYDSDLILLYLYKGYSLEDEWAADVNADGSITGYDSDLILLHLYKGYELRCP